MSPPATKVIWRVGAVVLDATAALLVGADELGEAVVSFGGCALEESSLVAEGELVGDDDCSQAEASTSADALGMSNHVVRTLISRLRCDDGKENGATRERDAVDGWA